MLTERNIQLRDKINKTEVMFRNNV